MERFNHIRIEADDIRAKSGAVTSLGEGVIEGKKSTKQGKYTNDE